MTTQASLLTGFCFGAMRGAADGENKTLIMIYLAFTSCSMGFGLLTISTASFCLIFGNEKALMGGVGALSSMEMAIDTLRAKSHQCFYCFVIQLFCFHLSSFLLMWILYNKVVALTVNIVLLTFLFFFVRNGYEIFS